MKNRVKEAVHASIEAAEIRKTLGSSLPWIDFENLGILNEAAQQIAIDDYSRHIRQSHFVPLPDND